MLKSTLKYLVVPIVLVIVIALITATSLIHKAKSYNADANLFTAESGLNESFYLKLGGVPQHIRIRSRDTDNPVLLDLHGGPGAALMSLNHRSLSPVSEYFTLVEWDQHGSGLSAGQDSEKLTYQQMVDETIELIEFLKQKFNVNKVVIVGHSWGSMLGLGVIHQRPDLVHAYVGVGQALAWNKGFEESRRLILDAARQAGDQETIKLLSELPASWPPKQDIDATLDHIRTIQAPLVAYKGAVYASASNDVFKGISFLDAALSPDIGIVDSLSLLSLSFASKQLMIDLHDKDLRAEFAFDYKVPMFIFQGEHDWQTPTTLVKPWFEKLNAPYKRYVAFDHSAHMLYTEEPGKFLVELVTQVRPFALSR